MAWGKCRKVDDLVENLKSNSSTSMYVLGMRQVGTPEALLLASALANNSSVKEFYMSGHNIGLEGVKAFADALKVNSSLETLCIGNDSLGDDGVKWLCHGIASNQSLRKFDVEGKGMGIQGGKHLGELLSKNISLNELVLSRNSIENEGMNAIFQGMSLNDSGNMRIIHASQCNLTSDGTTKLADYINITELCKLEILVLAENPIQKITSSFSLALAHNPSLTMLNLMSCNLGDDSCEAIGTFIKSNASLVELDLSRNSFSDVTAEGIANSLQANTTLNKLNLGYNKFSDLGASFFRSGFNSSFIQLEMSGNNLSAQGIQCLLECPTFVEIRAFDNKCGTGNMTCISSTLKNNHHLQVLDLGANGLKGIDIQVLACVLVDHPSLRTLEIGGNDIEDLGNQIIDDLKETNPKLDVARDKGGPDEQPPIECTLNSMKQ